MMNNCKKLELEWIPNAYSENADTQAQGKTAPHRRQNLLIVKSMDLYHAKPTRNKTKKLSKQ